MRRELWKSKISKYEALEKSNPKAVRGGYKNMLANACYSFYLAGRTEKSVEIYKELRERFPDNRSFKQDLIGFLRERQAEEMSSIGIHDAREEIIFLLREAYFRYAVYQDDEAAGREAWAQEVYDMYVEEFGDEEVKRVDLPSFDMMKFLAFVDFLQDPTYQTYLKQNLMGRIQVENPDLFKKTAGAGADFQHDAGTDTAGSRRHGLIEFVPCQIPTVREPAVRFVCIL